MAAHKILLFSHMTINLDLRMQRIESLIKTKLFECLITLLMHPSPYEQLTMTEICVELVADIILKLAHSTENKLKSQNNEEASSFMR